MLSEVKDKPVFTVELPGEPDPAATDDLLDALAELLIEAAERRQEVVKDG